MSLTSMLHELKTLTQSDHPLIVIETLEVSGMLRPIQSLDRSALYRLKDFGPHLEDPIHQRLLREVCQAVVSAPYRSPHEKTPCDQRKLLAELDATVPLSTSRREDIDRLRALAAERFVHVY